MQSSKKFPTFVPAKKSKNTQKYQIIIIFVF
nr:MAG TPA: hypothetical protein [Caudoviricetes sp.]